MALQQLSAEAVGHLEHYSERPLTRDSFSAACAAAKRHTQASNICPASETPVWRSNLRWRATLKQGSTVAPCLYECTRSLSLPCGASMCDTGIVGKQAGRLNLKSAQHRPACLCNVMRSGSDQSVIHLHLGLLTISTWHDNITQLMPKLPETDSLANQWLYITAKGSVLGSRQASDELSFASEYNKKHLQPHSLNLKREQESNDFGCLLV